MDHDFFTGRMREMIEFYGRKALTTEQLMHWYDRVRHIPAKAFEEITSCIMDESRYFPTPGEIRKGWLEWRSANPAMMTNRSENEPQQPCHECGGTGRIVYWMVPEWIQMQEKIYWYRYVCACASCENWRRTFPTKPSGPPGNYFPPIRLNKGEILRRGWLLEDPNKRFAGPARRYSSVEEMADGIGRG